MRITKREFLKTTGVLAASSVLSPPFATAGQPPAVSREVRVALPRGRVPLSFIIDDSTCLVNMGKFCMPQFAATYPDRRDYQKDWQQWPDEIPDSFVREFGSWCAEQGVRGKYSIVPYPACVGWLDRTLPGWSQKQLKDSLKLVRDLMVPNWDIHPEMITHTRVIDLKTGRPFAEISPATMENSYPQQDMSVDHLAAYLAYALKILKNCDLPCEGITTPGGFGNQVKDKLPLAVFEAVRDVYGCELPHYFKYISSGDESTEPRLEALRDEDSSSPSVVANVPAGTGDWFGGWDGVLPSQGDRYANEDATRGRMVELIEQGRPAIMLCHWPGMYCGGSLEGYRDFQRVVLALNRRFQDETVWMKVSEIGRYWTAKRLTKIQRHGNTVRLNAPFSCPNFTLRLPSERVSRITLRTGDVAEQLSSVSSLPAIAAGMFHYVDGEYTVCFPLSKGESRIELS